MLVLLYATLKEFFALGLNSSANILINLYAPVQ